MQWCHPSRTAITVTTKGKSTKQPTPPITIACCIGPGFWNCRMNGVKDIWSASDRVVLKAQPCFTSGAQAKTSWLLGRCSSVAVKLLILLRAALQGLMRKGQVDAAWSNALCVQQRSSRQTARASCRLRRSLLEPLAQYGSDTGFSIGRTLAHAYSDMSTKCLQIPKATHWAPMGAKSEL